MNGGTWTPGIEKERAGIYFRFQSAAQARTLLGDRGTVALPIVMGWGEPKKFIEINNDEDILKKLALDVNDPSLLLLREARKRAKTVLLYRVNEGTKATGTLPLDGAGTAPTVTAVFGGTKGNDITIVVSTNVLDATKKDITTFNGTKAVEKQTVADASELKPNAWVVFAGSGKLADSAGVKLANGADGTVTNLDYTDFLAAAETEYFDTIALPVDSDEQIKTTFVSFIKRVRDQQGVKVVGVLPNYAGDYEGIINVTNAAVLAERELTIAETVAWVVGASAGATINQSLTFMEYDNAVDVSPRFDNDEIIERLRNGEFILTYDARDKVASVEADINSFISFTKEKDKRFRKNKIIRILDAINNDLTRELKATIKELKNKGKDIPANADGIQIVSTLATIYMNELQANGAIKNFNASNDILISLTDEGDGFIINMGAQPVDSAEKYYFGMEVR
ncbi:phage tail sheath family protein [Metabacillus fastidiosus]|uniref:phage tail sheath family protein n=1 Tax=Metabacillus fastidiosus TaxID=1458 RepID=UPI003D2B67CE